MIRATGRYNVHGLLPVAIKALRTFAPRAHPQNISGGCSECGSTQRSVHRPRCAWVAARRAIAEFNLLKKSGLT